MHCFIQSYGATLLSVVILNLSVTIPWGLSATLRSRSCTLSNMTNASPMSLDMAPIDALSLTRILKRSVLQIVNSDLHLDYRPKRVASICFAKLALHSLLVNQKDVRLIPAKKNIFVKKHFGRVDLHTRRGSSCYPRAAQIIVLVFNTPTTCFDSRDELTLLLHLSPPSLPPITFPLKSSNCNAHAEMRYLATIAELRPTSCLSKESITNLEVWV